MLKLPAAELELMNELGNSGTPFLFVIDFLGTRTHVWRREEIPAGVKFSVPLCRDAGGNVSLPAGDIPFVVRPVAEERYAVAFDKVMHHLRRGDTYLINLTMPTEIEVSLTLEQIYGNSNAPYRLLFDGEFVCFSPEIFIRINDRVISSYPMKGTIDASVPHAEEKIRDDLKEVSEHNTIVDLIRNDLSMVAEEVRVKRYRYIDRVESRQRVLLQVSSEIAGVIPDGRPLNIGSIMSAMLPAGSVTGAPKKKTVEILGQAEGYERGYYTGVFGWFDGKNLDSGVMIRFIEQHEDNLVYKSGGGITALSNMKSEYEELTDKVYIPFASVVKGR
jgi:para-aminobenzoate synthetase component I